MSSKTYLPLKNQLKHAPGKLRLVMTRSPQKYASDIIPGQLEFTSYTPKQVINHLKKNGVKKALLASGSIITSLFFKAKLINRFLLTLEPQIFGLGTPLIADIPLNVKLKLKNHKKLNSQGTLLLNYQVLY